MSCFDCKKMHPKCKAQCCGIVPIPKEIYKNNQENIIRTPHQIIENEETFIPLTKDSYCVFLNEDLSCNIYEERPDICRKFGDESHPMLCCPVLDKNGNERCRQNRREIERQNKKFMNKLNIIK